LMAKTTSLLRCLAKSMADAGSLLQRVNEEICERASFGMFVTIIAGYLDRARGVIELANAGHQPALLVHADGRREEIPAAAPPLGVLADIDFPCTRVDLERGSIYLYTDGVSESVDAQGQELGAEGLAALLQGAGARGASERLDAVVDAWRRAGFVTHDDITLMLVEVE